MSRATLLEKRAIEFIPADERRGRARDLFAVWFTPNVAVTNITVGAIIFSLGLSLPTAIAAILLGNIFGTLMMAGHSAQGPVMGVPQMIQTRAQFGVRGSLLPIVLAIAVQLGWFAVLAVLSGQTLAALTGAPIILGVLISSALVLIITIFGHDMLQRYANIVSWLTVALIIVMCVKVFFLNDTPKIEGPSDSVGLFLLAVAICSSGPMTWAPFVADYSRYLPESTSSRAAFWFTFAGCGAGGAIAMSLGMVLAVQSGGGDTIANLGGQFGAQLSWLVLPILFLGLVQGNVLDLYSASLSSVTLINTFQRLKSRVNASVLRVVVAIIGCAVMTVLAILATQSDFLYTYQNYLLVLLYLLLPWTAINLVDFYVVRRGHYKISELYDHRGPYRGTRWGTVIVYVLAVLAQLPFINTALFVGPLVEPLGGGDIAWAVGLVVAGVLQYFYETRIRPTGTGSRTSETLDSRDREPNEATR